MELKLDVKEEGKVFYAHKKVHSFEWTINQCDYFDFPDLFPEPVVLHFVRSLFRVFYTSSMFPVLASMATIQ